MVYTAESEIGTDQEKEKPDIKDELGQALMREGTTRENIIQILEDFGRDTSREKLMGVIDKALKLFAENREYRIRPDDVRYSEDTKDEIGDILFWSEPREEQNLN